MLTRKEVYELLVESKKHYEAQIAAEDLYGMCLSIDEACEMMFPYEVLSHSYSYLQALIPEFNPEFLQSSCSTGSYWWPKDDTESRLEAFDTLISIYSK